MLSVVLENLQLVWPDQVGIHGNADGEFNDVYERQSEMVMLKVTFRGHLHDAENAQIRQVFIAFWPYF